MKLAAAALAILISTSEAVSIEHRVANLVRQKTGHKAADGDDDTALELSESLTEKPKNSEKTEEEKKQEKAKFDEVNNLMKKYDDAEAHAKLVNSP